MEALIIVDVQNDFLPGGALAVQEGDQVIPVINRIAGKYDLVVATQDWHPADHKSFASQHENKKPGDKVELLGMEQVLWPDHCVQGTKGAEFSSQLDQSRIEKLFQKGIDQEIDSYSGFFDNGHKRDTGLNGYLKEKKVDAITIAGLTTDYCVRYSTLDALQLGYKVSIIAYATRAVGGKEAYDKTLTELQEKGAVIVWD
jgi:nicotinamidase/pyrazinamidase